MAQMSTDKMYKALLNRDKAFEGLFFVAVKTTGIFCRPTCSARKPKRENVEFFANTKEALHHGYRPCKVCLPMTSLGETPDWMKTLMKDISSDLSERFNDASIRRRGLDPNRVRRWFKKNHNMTFQAYLRSLRLGQAFGHISKGGKVIDTAFEHGYESLSGFTDAFKKLTGTSPKISRGTDMISVHQILTPLGPMIAGATKDGICLLEFIDRKGIETQLKSLQKKLEAPLVTSLNSHIKKLKTQLDEYFAGDRRDFDLDLVTPGSDFQKKVWKVLQTIPYGKTRSYKEQAVAVGNPAAVRAVARANGMNRIAIVIPCHRVIGSNGEPVGYAGGVWRKKHLLDLEKNKK